MEKTDEINHADDLLKDLTATNDIQTFKPEEMLTCEKCGRKSPPTRADCFYCGAALPISELQTELLKLNLRKLENWEKGFNVIFLKRKESLNSEKIARIATFLEFENEDLRRILESASPLPLARAESRSEAEIIVEKLAKNNIESLIVEDRELRVETAARRLRGIEFFADKLVLILFNKDEIVEISANESALIIVGALFERKIESTESIKRKEKGKVLDSTETGTDAPMIDIYPQNDYIGYRIESNGFDFSSLENDKSLLAAENMKRLAEKLKKFLPNAEYDENYVKIRGELGKVWEVEEKNDTGGVNRRAFGSFRRNKTVIISNESQFTRYSRLRKRIL